MQTPCVNAPNFLIKCSDVKFRYYALQCCNVKDKQNENTLKYKQLKKKQKNIDFYM